MPHYYYFEELNVYQLARLQCQSIWNLIQTTPLKNDFILRDQMNRSSGSVMDNIAEGFGRDGNREFISFLSISKGSCCETKAQIQRAYDRRYFDRNTFEECSKMSQSIIDQISRLITFLKNSEKKGAKFPVKDK